MATDRLNKYKEDKPKETVLFQNVPDVDLDYKSFFPPAVKKKPLVATEAQKINKQADQLNKLANELKMKEALAGTAEVLKTGHFTTDVVSALMQTTVPFDHPHNELSVPSDALRLLNEVWDGKSEAMFWEALKLFWCHGAFSDRSFEYIIKQHGTSPDSGQSQWVWKSRFHRILGSFQWFYATGVIQLDTRYIIGDAKNFVQPQIQPKVPAFAMPEEVPSQSTPQTQKAKGIAFLRRWQFQAQDIRHVLLSNKVLRRLVDNEPEPKATGKLYYEVIAVTAEKGRIFARPCPKNPRHGFVDSRVLTLCSKGEAWENLRETFATLAKETLEADPEGEMIIMTPINASHNMILTPSALTIGLGNDGATSGKAAISIGTNGKPSVEYFGLKSAVGVTDSSAIFAEMVATRSLRSRGEGIGDVHGGFFERNLYKTQLRGGPQIQSTSDYIPRPVTINPKYALSVMKNEEEEFSLVEWEKLIGNIRNKEDWDKYYVLHPDGAVSCHFGVHCVINEIPYIVTKVNEGDTLTLNAVKKEANRDSIIAGFEKGIANVSLPSTSVSLQIVLASLHNYPYLDLSQPAQAEFFGMGIGLAMRLSLAACLGEMRYSHYRTSRIDYDINRSHTFSREQVYDMALLCDINFILDKAYRLCPRFAARVWTQEKKVGVGGYAWLNCSQAAFELWNAMCRLYTSNDSASLKRLSSALNKVINVCHNASKMLTKFSRASEFDRAAANPSDPLTQAAPIIYDLIKFGQRAPVQYLEYELPNELWDSDTIRRIREQEGYPTA